MAVVSQIRYHCSYAHENYVSCIMYFKYSKDGKESKLSSKIQAIVGFLRLGSIHLFLRFALNTLDGVDLSNDIFSQLSNRFDKSLSRWKQNLVDGFVHLGKCILRIRMSMFKICKS